MPAIPHQMQAIVAEAPGGPLRLARVSTPRPGPGQVLVRIAASGVNPLDTKILAGSAEHAKQALPAILGLDMAGIVVEAGSGVTTYREGDAVCGMIGGVGGPQGSLAEYVAADTRLLTRKPGNLTMRGLTMRGLTMRGAAALPLVFITAWEGLVDRASVRAGQHVLVQGGAGGVGQMVLQIAKSFGARVAATGSPTSRTTIERLGATFVDGATPAADAVAHLTGGQGFDIVYDTAGGASLDASFTMVRRFGHVVSALGWGTHALAPLSFRAASYSGVFTLLPLLIGEGRDRHGAILAEATRLAEAGQLVPTLDPHRLTLATVGDAFRAIEAGTARGKIVVDLEEEPAP
jgi:NADPH2:quinone reductase